MSELSNNIFNFLLGFLSILAIISGFLIKEYQVLFWSVGSALLIVVALGYSVMENKNKIEILTNRFKNIEKSLNIYDRLNKIELTLEKMNKNGSINLLDIIKIGLAIILIYAFINVFSSMR
jgi:hypothetical protein